ncbi:MULTISPECIES: hypothetical protein [Catenuloplanes]|uniref:Uncharacterized protein n=1 Tax=Catenuloplanes niger TaxID=587534 RepID=A0AAE4CSE4_9ACTN|nr:hypothetical protein [Catenuloplanes niger]MDR7321178.1 hypothetical protein [Catenuloplanes niger]
MMDEEFHSSAIDDAFASFRSGSALPAPVGPAAARATVRRRRQVRAGVTGGLTALLIAAPVAAYAAGVIGTTDPPVTPATAPPSPSVPSPSPSPSPSASGDGPGTVPDGRIDEETLRDSTIELSAWPHAGRDHCPAGPQRFTDHPPGQATGPQVMLESVVHVDVDSDGAEETAAVITCQWTQAPELRVVVFDRDENGKIITVGDVIATKSNGRVDGVPENIRGVRASGNDVQVEVGDLMICCAGPVDAIQWQWRTYSLDGDTFRQTGGETRFQPNPDAGVDTGSSPSPTGSPGRLDDLRVESATMSGTTTGGTFTGTLSITFRNGGPQSVHPVLGIALPQGAELKTVPSGCARDDDAGVGNPDGEKRATYVCPYPVTRGGSEVKAGPFEVTGPASAFPPGASKVAYVEVRGAANPGVWPAPGDAMPEANLVNNFTNVPFTVG